MKKVMGVLFLVGLVVFSYFIFFSGEEYNELGDVDNTLEGSISISFDEPVTINGETTLVVNDGSVLDGFSIDIPDGAYTEEVVYSISYKDFSSTDVPDLFDAASPLISIDNNHVIAKEGLTVSIPIDIDTEGEFVMAFYYDDETDTYEGIPTLEYSDTELVIYTTHFSDIIVSKVMIATLIEDIQENPEDYDSGFDASIDGLPFENMGSSVSIGGYCAGAAIFSKWYYENIKLEKEEEDLFTRFNNDTPDFDNDDNDAIRMVSMVQERMYMLSEVHGDYLRTQNTSEYFRFLQLAYSLKISNGPKMLEIGTQYTEDSDLENGHAVLLTYISYKGSGTFELGVYDPNFPGENRTFNFKEESGFGDYTSGLNSNDLGTVYTEFLFSGRSSIYNIYQIEDYYNQLLLGMIGDDTFADVGFSYLVAYNGEYVLDIATKEFEYTDIAYNNSVGKINLAANNLGRYNRVTFYSNFDIQNQMLIIDYPLDGVIMREADLLEGNNDMGILVYLMDGNYWYQEYFDFDITYNPENYIAIESDIVGEYTEVSRGDNAPDWPTDRTITFNPGNTGSVSYFSDTSASNNTFWMVKSKDSNIVVEVAIDGTLKYEDYTFDSDNKTLTYKFSTDEEIVYKLNHEELDLEEVREEQIGFYTINEYVFEEGYDHFRGFMSLELYSDGTACVRSEMSSLFWRDGIQCYYWEVLQEDELAYVYIGTNPDDINFYSSYRYHFAINHETNEIYTDSSSVYSLILTHEPLPSFNSKYYISYTTLDVNADKQVIELDSTQFIFDNNLPGGVTHFSSHYNKLIISPNYGYFKITIDRTGYDTVQEIVKSGVYFYNYTAEDGKVDNFTITIETMMENEWTVSDTFQFTITNDFSEVTE